MSADNASPVSDGLDFGLSQDWFERAKSDKPDSFTALAMKGAREAGIVFNAQTREHLVGVLAIGGLDSHPNLIRPTNPKDGDRAKVLRDCIAHLRTVLLQEKRMAEVFKNKNHRLLANAISVLITPILFPSPPTG